MSVITNIAAYQFSRLENLRPIRERLLFHCKAWGLKGTILLSGEGINLFVAGPGAEIDLLIAELRAIPGLEKLNPKFSESDDQPFTRMLVRIKKEIISFGVEGIDPATRTSPKLRAQELKQWLDEGRPVTLLDTRNDYEVKLGTFKGAHILDIDHFRQFPDAVRKLPSEWKQAPIVMFCTGGIRCEKAGPFMEREGFEHIFQLEGGILKYFEEVGGDHYEGECFVFDQRVGVDPGLRETDSAICYQCQTPLTVDDQRDPRFVPHESCPYCFRSTEEEMQRTIGRRYETIRVAGTPLPGSIPYENSRPLNIPAACDGWTLLETLCFIFGHTPREEWLGICREGRFRDEAGQIVEGNQKVRAGERYHRWMPGTVEPAVNIDIHIQYEDEAIVIVDKPAPLPMHPGGRFNRNTLQYFLHAAYAPQKIHAAHRLDANTTGLVVCTRTRHFAKLLQPQFARNEVEKVYLARILGHPPTDSFTCNAPIGTEAITLGARQIDELNGQEALTQFKVLERLPDQTTLLEARPLTGRTNQIRIHLWELGFAICGDPVYLPGKQLGDTQTLPLGALPLCLHAWQISFKHPLTQQRVWFQTEKPVWAITSN